MTSQHNELFWVFTQLPNDYLVLYQTFDVSVNEWVSE